VNNRNYMNLMFYLVILLMGLCKISAILKLKQKKMQQQLIVASLLVYVVGWYAYCNSTSSYERLTNNTIKAPQ